MTDPLDKATSRAPATLGEGCLSRYDPQDMDEEDGTEFPGAAELWEKVKPEPDENSASSITPDEFSSVS
ncbi:hypothetical protein [Pseudomonas botevensis]|uniref:hypothetical protein n=1 Tax=Pseudomonas botevensis TaxID=2842352 RepID=UPI001C3C669D|nr:hypothetical protein [Pseudomonas botevensis]MBV4476386.1 hypothetical protein [Pseudomonas botevensis]